MPEHKALQAEVASIRQLVEEMAGEFPHEHAVTDEQIALIANQTTKIIEIAVSQTVNETVAKVTTITISVAVGGGSGLLLMFLWVLRLAFTVRSMRG